MRATPKTLAALIACYSGSTYAADIQVANVFAPAVTPMVSSTSTITPQDTQQSRKAFVVDLVQSVLRTMHDSHKTFPQKQEALQQLFTTSVDGDWIARFVIGKTWNTASDAQKTQYVQLYRTYLTSTYVSHFDEESESKLRNIKLISMRDEDVDSFRVQSEMILAESNPVKVDYLIRAANGGYKIIDISVEGVSMLATHRSEFGQLSSSGGIENIINKLQEKVNRNHAV